MSHSPVQRHKKAMARAEAVDHMQHSNMLDNRHDMDHESHKNADIREHDDYAVQSEADFLKRGFANADGDFENNRLALKRKESESNDRMPRAENNYSTGAPYSKST